MKSAIAFIGLVAAASMARAELPAALTRQLPAGYAVPASATVVTGRTGRVFAVVVLGRRDEGQRRSGVAPARPLLIFERQGRRFVPVGRNDHVVLRADEGGQCDPFLDGDAVIATKGRYFTVQNGVACGQHWTDYVTFRFDAGAGGFVFDNQRSESWSMNPDNAPDAGALIRDAPPRVVRDQPARVTAFSKWRRPR